MRARPLAVSTLVLTFVAVPATRARADDIPCGRAEKGVIQVDGLLDDWTDVRGLDVGDGDRDLSFVVRCNHDDEGLYLAIDVRDDYLVRTRDARPGEDHVEVTVADPPGRARGPQAVDRLLFYPADGAIKRKVAWASGRPLKGALFAESRQREGWSVELGLPLGMLPEWGPGAPLVHLAVAVSDCDAKSTLKPERVLETAPARDASTLGAIEFAEGRAALEGFLRDTRKKTSDIKLQLVGDVSPGGKGRVVLAPPWLGILWDEYAYIELPARTPDDIRDVQLLDLAGDGREAVVLRYVERGGGGSREVLAAYQVTDGALRRTFGVEIAKAQGPKRLETKVRIAQLPPGKGSKGGAKGGKAGKAARGGVEIVVEAAPAVGWTEETYREATAEDVVPIPTPWGESRRLRFQFRPDGYFRIE